LGLACLGLTSRRQNALEAAGITSLGALVDWTKPDPTGFCRKLTDIPGIGWMAAEAIESAVATYREDRRLEAANDRALAEAAGRCREESTDG
jgi:hypothetical protein